MRLPPSAFHRHLAFVGLSKIRETAIFGDAPIAAYHDRLKCGLEIIDVSSGNTVTTLEFTTGVEGSSTSRSFPKLDL